MSIALIKHDGEVLPYQRANYHNDTSNNEKGDKKETTLETVTDINTCIGHKNGLSIMVHVLT